jgi:hypothetical protein
MLLFGMMLVVARSLEPLINLKLRQNDPRKESREFTLTGTTKRLSRALAVVDLSLDATELVDFTNAPSWNIIKVGHGRDSSLHQIAVDPVTNLGNVLKINYPKGSYKPSGKMIVGGIGIYAAPTSIFPCRSVGLSYELFFPADFNPVKGGKLPGLFIGPPGASGGNHVTGQASSRIMWRKNNVQGGIMTEAYVYVPQPQDPAYTSIPNLILDPTYGDSLWRGLLNYNKGSWNKIDMLLTLNTITSGVANHDGKLSLTINGVTQHYDKFIWTTIDTLITGIVFDTFFGGSDSSWATPVDTSTYFKNFHLQKVL